MELLAVPVGQASGRLRRCGEKLSGERQQGGPSGVREESELPDADEASRQNVLGKAAEELRRFQQSSSSACCHARSLSSGR